MGSTPLFSNSIFAQISDSKIEKLVKSAAKGNITEVSVRGNYSKRERASGYILKVDYTINNPAINNIYTWFNKSSEYNLIGSDISSSSGEPSVFVFMPKKEYNTATYQESKADIDIRNAFAAHYGCPPSTTNITTVKLLLSSYPDKTNVIDERYYYYVKFGCLTFVYDIFLIKVL